MSSSRDDRINSFSENELAKWLSHFRNIKDNEPEGFLPPDILEFVRDNELENCSPMSSMTFEDGFLSRVEGIEEEIGYFLPDQSGLESTVLSRGAFTAVSVYLSKSGSWLASKLISKPVRASLCDEVRCLQAMSDVSSSIRLVSHRESSKHIEMILPFYERGDLFSCLKMRGRFPEPEAAKICAQLASFLSFANRRCIMHRDLKLENILLKSEDSDTDVCVADFGMATFFAPGQKFSDVMGTSPYMSPNMVMGCYGPETDLWSLGIVLYTLLSGHYLFTGSSNEEVLQRVVDFQAVDFGSQPWSTISIEARQLISGLLERDESKRLTAAQVLSHSWVRLYAPEI